jgi:hypothetical protein
MAHAYTPGLKVTERTKVVKDRRLPLSGDVLVSAGQKVTGQDIVARTALPGNVTTLNVAGLLGVPPEDISGMMLKKVNEPIDKGEVIAQSKGFFGLFKSAVHAPITGTIESISEITGQMILREPPQPVEVTAYIDGEVTEVFPREGVLVETVASMIQGIFGIGGETRGELITVVNSPDEALSDKQIDEKCKGKIVIGGSLCEESALEKAKSVGAKGIVAGGVEDESLKKFLGYDIGVAITGSEKIGVTLVVTEGFGKMRMANHTFNLLKSLNGKIASMNGATQIRAGVIRPEVIVPCADKKAEIKSSIRESGLEINTLVRIIRQPFFGLLGKVVALPVELQVIETESKVRVLEVELENGKRITLPRANVEIIES